MAAWYWNIVQIIFFLITTLFIFKFIKYRYFNKLSIPGPSGWPFFGYFFNLGSSPHILFTELSKKYGDIFKLQIGLRDVVVLNGYQVIKDTLAEQAVEFAGRPVCYSGKFLQKQGAFIFADYNATFKESRRLSVKALGMVANARNPQFENILFEGAKMLVDAFKANANKLYNPLDVTIRVAGFTTTATVFGRTVLYDDKQLKMIKGCAVFEASMIQTDIPDFFPIVEFWFNKKDEEWKTFFKELKNWCGMEAEKHLESFNDDVTEDFMDGLLQLFKKQSIDINKNQLTGILADMMEAGVGTTNSTLLWTVLLLAAHPDIQVRAQKEIDSVISKGQQIVLEDASSMPYIEALILEIHRYASIVPLNAFHRTTKDAKINGLLIPDNTFIITNLWSVHRDKRIWSSPDIFDPTRFFIPGTNEIDSSAASKIYPFSAGRRRCPGEVMSKMQLFLLIANLIKHFTFETPPGKHLDHITHIFAIVVWPQPYDIIIRLRN